MNGDDTALFNSGIRKLLQHPGRELVFAGFELARFVLHHGTTGFADSRVRVFHRLLGSQVTALVLKLFNLALYAVPPLVAWRLRRAGSTVAEIWRVWSSEVRFGILVAALYSCVYLTVYGFATTAVRMVYPIAPLLVIFDALLIGAARAVLRPGGSAP